MIIEDYSVKRKFSLKRFGIELSIFLILCNSIYFYFIQDVDRIIIILSFLICYSLLSVIFFQKVLIPIQLLFIGFFSIISKITNPLLITLSYILGIAPFGFCYKVYLIFSKKNNGIVSYWNDVDTNVKNIDLTEQY